jgi:GGDEF domain-containing protein
MKMGVVVNDILRNKKYPLLIGSGCPPVVMNEKLQNFRKMFSDGLNVTISGGIVKYDGDLEEALSKADGLLYRAKEEGRNKVIIEY